MLVFLREWIDQLNNFKIMKKEMLTSVIFFLADRSIVITEDPYDHHRIPLLFHDYQCLMCGLYVSHVSHKFYHLKTEVHVHQRSVFVVVERIRLWTYHLHHFCSSLYTCINNIRLIRRLVFEKYIRD